MRELPIHTVAALGSQRTEIHGTRWRVRAVRWASVAILAIGPSAGLARAQTPLSPPSGAPLPLGHDDTTRGGPGASGGYFVDGTASWARWWALNREPFLAQIRTPDSGPAIAMPLNGERPTGPIHGLNTRKVFSEVVPALQGRLKRARNVDLVVSCLLALGKIGEAPRDLAKELELRSVESSIQPRLRDTNKRVREAALIALGLVGGPKAAVLLTAMVNELPEGKKALGGGRVDQRSRAFATYALGLTAHHSRRLSERTFAVAQLIRTAEEHFKDTEVGAAAVISLGWAPLPLAPPASNPDADVEGQESTIRRLYALFERRGTDLRTRAHIPAAIARLIRSTAGQADPQVALAIAGRREQLRIEFLGHFAAGLATRGGEKVDSAREGLTQGLGILAEPRAEGPDKDAIEQLLKVAKKGEEREGGLALVALARIAARVGNDQGGPRAEVARGITSNVSKLATKGNRDQRPWAALSLGLFEEKAIAAGAPPSLESRVLLRRLLVKAQGPEERSAAGIALGLASDEESIPLLIQRLSGGEYTFATALGLLRANAAIPRLSGIAANPLVAAIMTREASISLALLHADSLVGLLWGNFTQAELMPERIAALQGLAWCNDLRAVPNLLYVLRKPIGMRSIDDTSRAFAAAALGALCSRRSLPWNAHLALDITWNDAPPSLTSPRNGGGVLDLF
ncbi:MAG: hypothetical protein ACJAQ3_001981 [Planctomycetota bacterium]|jgi:hypothetical protein